MEHEIKINGHRFTFGLRDIIQALVTIGACVGLYFTIAARTNQNASDIETGRKDRDKIWTEIDRMNSNGTRHSEKVDATQQEMIDSNKAQVAEINRTIRDMQPKVDKIDTNVLWLMAKQLEHK